MATSGSFVTTGYKDSDDRYADQFTFSWSLSSQSVSGNYSVITWSLVGSGGSGNYWTYVKEKYVTVNGVTQSNETKEAVSNGTVVFSGTSTIYHNSDGTKSFSASAGGAFYSYGSYNSTGSGTWSLPTIARSSTITSASNVTLGNSCNIKWTPANSSFKYKIKFTIGSWSHTTGYINPNTTSQYTYTGYVVPRDSSILDDIPNSTAGTMTATLYTYNSSNTQIGSASSKTFSVTIPSDIVPTVGTITLTPETINNQNILVQGKNKIAIGVVGCSAGNGSSIKSYTFSGPGISTTTASSTVSSSGPISNTGTLTYTVTVTDNRGRTSSKTATITCYSCSAPSIKLSAYRVASSTGTNEDDNGSYLRCTYDVTYASVNNTNDITVTIYYKKRTESSWMHKAAMVDGTNTSGSVVLSGIDIGSTYTVYATVIDNYNGSTQSDKLTILSAERTINVTQSGSGIAFGKMADTDNLFDCKWPIKTGGNYVATQPISLFNSTSNGAFGTIELNDSVANYEYLEIYYADDSGTTSPSSIRICSPNNKTIDLTCTQASSASVYIIISRYTVVGNAINFIRSKRVTLQNSSSPGISETTSTSYTRILRVLGFN